MAQNGTKTANAELRFRLADDRPQLDRQQLTAAGFQIIESRHLVLVTDLSQESVKDLPALADALYDTLEARLGILAPDITGRPFQVTGFLMDAQERFEHAGLLPSKEFTIRHGRHLGYRFWMNNQPVDYYRRHLMLHEFVHCYLMCEFGMQDIPPLWYTEGIAEYFATHQMEPDVSKSQFGILPPSTAGFEGWLRIAEIKRNLNLEPSTTGEPAGHLPLEALLHPPGSTFASDSQYAHAWAVVWLINHHPQLQPLFAPVAKTRTRQQFNDCLAGISEAMWKQIHQIWPLYLDGLAEANSDIVSFPMINQSGQTTAKGASPAVPLEFELDANRQWVSTDSQLRKGQAYRFEASGRYVVEKSTQPWWSEPNGITIDYVRGLPLGQVIATVVSLDGTQFTRHIPVGTECTFTPPFDGVLWLQVNDGWSQRRNNEGSVRVHVTAN